MKKKKTNKILIFFVSIIFIVGIMSKAVYADAPALLFPVLLIIEFFKSIFPYIILLYVVVIIIVLIIALTRKKKK